MSLTRSVVFFNDFFFLDNPSLYDLKILPSFYYKTRSCFPWYMKWSLLYMICDRQSLSFHEINRNTPKTTKIPPNPPKSPKIYRNSPKSTEIPPNLPKSTEIMAKSTEIMAKSTENCSCFNPIRDLRGSE